MFSVLAVGYLFLGGAGAGAIAVASILDLAWVKAPFGHASRIGIGEATPLERTVAVGMLAGFGALALGMLFLLFDLGRIDRVASLLLRPSLSFLTVGTYTLAGLAACAALLVAVRFAYLPSVPRGAVRAVEAAAAVVAVVVMAFVVVIVALVIMVMFMVMALVIVIVIVALFLRQRRDDDLILCVTQRGGQPCVVMPATCDENIGVLYLCHVGCGRFVGVRIDVVGRDNRVDGDLLVVGDCVGDVRPDLGGGDHLNGVFGLVRGRSAVIIAGACAETCDEAGAGD